MIKYTLLFLFFAHTLISQTALNILSKTERFHLIGEMDSVKKYAETALAHIKTEEDITTLNRTNYFLVQSIIRSKPDSAIKVLNNLNSYFEKTNDLKYLTLISASLGQYYRRKGNFDKAILSFENAIKFGEKYFTENESELLPRIIASQYNSLAAVNFDRSEFELSNKFALKALKIANQNGIKQTEGASYIIIGNIQMHFNQLDQAQNSFLTSLNLAIKTNDFLRQGLSLANLGIINLILLEKNFNDKNAYSNSIKYFEKALKIAFLQKDYLAISARYSNLANVENLKGNNLKAQKHLFEALKYGQLSSSKVLSLQISTALARNYLNLNDTKMAIEIANDCIKLSKEISNEKELPSLYDILQKASLKENDLRKAIEYQNLKSMAKDSLFSKNSNEKILELQTKYETEKKQKEIELLSAQNQASTAKIQQKNTLIISSIIALFSLLGVFYFWNRQRRQKEVQLAAETKQRLLRAQLNPHFLFNSLNSIQRLYVEGKTMLANDFIADFAQLMRDILEKTGRTTIPLYEEIDFIESYLSLEKRRLGDKFDFEITMADDLRNGDFEVPSFIVQPLAENALLHGILPNKKKGEIIINVHKKDKENIEISVIDNGVGYYHSNKDKNHISRGMELIINRLSKKGELFIEELKGLENEILGTKITLELKY
jgi:tetratricopeptide (TPR) repeat protein